MLFPGDVLSHNKVTGLMFDSDLIRLQQQEDKQTRGETQKYMQTGNLFGKLGMLAHLVLSIISFLFFETQYLGPIT